MKNVVISEFVRSQLSVWKTASDNFRALDNVLVKEVCINSLVVKLQFNPARMISSAAKLDKADIARRRCFLCEQNRPHEQQWYVFKAEGGNIYHVLVNPYPIFPEHLVVALAAHEEQGIAGRYVDMLSLAAIMQDRTFFYNGPRSGASAPDHHHFQAAPAGLIPVEVDIEAEYGQNKSDSKLKVLLTHDDAVLYHYDKFVRGIFVIKSKTSGAADRLLTRLLCCAETPQGEPEPLFNLFTYCRGGEYTSIVVFRTRHRSHHYFSQGEDHLTMSPGCADMGGVFIVPVKEEFEKISHDLLMEMLEEITLSRDEQTRIIKRLVPTQPLLEVGIVSGQEIVFDVFRDGRGPRKAVFKDGQVECEGKLCKELLFKSAASSSTFSKVSFALYGVTIGVNFHWERKEIQRFAGDLKIIADGDRLYAINIVGVEDYLVSVISSEMSAKASEEFLKAHAVISRSWVMSRIRDSRACSAASSCYGKEDDYMKWYDHDDHNLFDVCADDHCQRYQGLTRASEDRVRRAVEATWGQVLMYGEDLCDARFSKCCGGVMERFSTCWQDKDYPYLQALPDTPGHDPQEKPFCATSDRDILEQVLNDYDRVTTDFYEWTQEYGPEELGRLVERNTGSVTGDIKALEPLERGASGRISRLRVVGQLKTIVVGKELEIRRILSDTHLKSSAFDVEYVSSDGTLVEAYQQFEKIRLKGRGWGHGVGLCQIGAAVMASRGYDYREILAHYYIGTTLYEGI